MVTCTPVARCPGSSADPVPVSGSSTLDTVTSSVEVPAWTRCAVPTGAPRGRGRRRRGGRPLVVAVALVLDAGLDDAVALRAVEPWGEEPQPAAPSTTAAPSATDAHSRGPRGMREGRTTVAQHTQPGGKWRRPDGRSCPTGTRSSYSPHFLTPATRVANSAAGCRGGSKSLCTPFVMNGSKPRNLAPGVARAARRGG